MRKALALPLATLALAALSACGGGAKNEALEANETVGGDSNAMGEAVADVNAAEAAAAFNAAEESYTGNMAGMDTSVPDGNEIVE